MARLHPSIIMTTLLLGGLLAAGCGLDPVKLAPAEAPELQVRHARPRAKEDEQDLASQLAGTAKV